MQLKTILFTIIVFIVAFLLISFLIPRSRKFFLCTVKYSLGGLWGIVVDYAPGKQNGFWAIPLFLLALILVSLVTIFFIVALLVAGPISSIIKANRHPEKVDAILQFDKGLHAPRPVPPQKTPEEIAEENRLWNEKLLAVRFTVERKDISFDPDEHEVFFYTPESNPEVESAITSHYNEIRQSFKSKNLNFVFLPYFNKDLRDLLKANIASYYNPKAANIRIPPAPLSYQDIKEALIIPEKVNGPCFIRCKWEDEDPLVFSFCKIELPENGDIMPTVRYYLNNVGDRMTLYQLRSDEDIRLDAEGKPADERFDDDIYLIGEEIRERIEQLRAKGLSTLAIRKLIGDDSDKPSKLLIDDQKRLILTDYNNKEIKLSPLHKAVFFLFLRHPEGIYFKDLGSYREELRSIYEEISGRDDTEAIEESIAKLTDPFDNSINEKCARIKNAFVSEFREEVAQWYFIDGKKGERKRIKLPRELVTWEIKD